MFRSCVKHRKIPQRPTLHCANYGSGPFLLVSSDRNTLAPTFDLGKQSPCPSTCLRGYLSSKSSAGGNPPPRPARCLVLGKMKSFPQTSLSLLFFSPAAPSWAPSLGSGCESLLPHHFPLPSRPQYISTREWATGTSKDNTTQSFYPRPCTLLKSPGLTERRGGSWISRFRGSGIQR